MNAGTLAHRFRTQRTDRIRLDELEVFSMVELSMAGPTRIELVVEQGRDDVAQGLILLSPETPLAVERSVPDPGGDGPSTTSQCALGGEAGNLVELIVDADGPSPLHLWNAWIIGGVEHAWTGNSGIVVEELDAPAGVERRIRLWCSDGLGDATFDDLVCVLTIAGEEQGQLEKN